MIRRLVALAPDRRRLLLLLGLHAVKAVLQGLLLALLFPVLRALLRPEPDLAAAAPWLVAGAVGVLAYWALAVATDPLGYSVYAQLAGQLRMRVLQHATTLPLGAFTPAGRADVVRAGTVAATIARAVVVIGGPTVDGLVVPATLVVVVLVVEPRIALVLLVVLLAALATLRRCRRVTAEVVTDIEVAGNAVAGRALEFGHAQAVLRAAGAADRGTEHLRAAVADHRRRYAAGLNRLLGPDQAHVAVVGVGAVAVLVLGAHLLLTGALPVADAVALLVITTRFLEPLAGVVGYAGAIGVIDSTVRTLDRVLTAAPLPAPARPSTAPVSGGIEFDDVGFRYPGSTSPALSGATFSCPAGSTTALVGPSGSGKTTVTRLVARFFDVDTGRVRIGGVDVREHAALLDGIAIVFQDVHLFDATIAENLRAARPDATAEELADAARDARLDEVVERLPQGWSTTVGVGGAQLSGGERQRVSIARALLKRAPIVLVDEAASALDPENELAVARAVARLAADPDRTVVVIAHRPATLAAADHVVALDGGRVVETGTPAELLAAGGTFARLHSQYERARSWRITA